MEFLGQSNRRSRADRRPRESVLGARPKDSPPSNGPLSAQAVASHLRSTTNHQPSTINKLRIGTSTCPVRMYMYKVCKDTTSSESHPSSTLRTRSSPSTGRLVHPGTRHYHPTLNTMALSHSIFHQLRASKQQYRVVNRAYNGSP